MKPSERIGRLEGLLARIRRNVSRPRVPAEKAALPKDPPLAAAAPTAAKPEPSPPPPQASLPQASPTQASPPVAPPLQPAAAPSWPPEPPSAVQAAQLSSLPPEELSEDDLLDVTTLPPAPAQEEITHIAAAGNTHQGVDIDFDAQDEAPASSRRSKVAESLDQALSGAAERLEDGREVPVKTPPPESGPQEAALPLQIEQPGVPELTSLEQDLPAEAGPTAEQLGDTIELGVPSRVPIELDPQQSLKSPQLETPDELEVSLPRRELPSGMYDSSLNASPPAEARAEAAEPAVTPPTDRPPAYPPLAAPLSAETTARPAVGGISVARVIPARPAATRSFLETLDAALALEP